MGSLSQDFVLTRAEPCWLQIERHIERLIQNQVLSPNERLPSSRELASTFNVSYKVAQQAMKHLKSRGLVARSPRRGSFVRSPTDKAVIGILIGPSLLAPNAHFYRAVVDALKRAIGTCGFQERVYDHVNEPMTGTTDGRSVQVLHDMRHQVFKGLVSISVAPGQVKSEVFSGRLPRVIYGGTSDETTVEPDQAGFARLTVEHLVRAGRHQPLYLRGADLRSGSTHDLDGFWDAVKASGLKCGKESIHLVEDYARLNGRSIEQLGYDTVSALIRDWERTERWPDSLIAGDDVLMKGVALGLRDHAVTVPQRLLVVSAASEGIDHYYAVPVVRVETSPAQIAVHLLDLLWRQILGKQLPRLPVRVPYQVNRNLPAVPSFPGLRP